MTGEAKRISSIVYELNGAAVFTDEDYSASAYFYYSTEYADADNIKAKGKRVSAGTVSTQDPTFKTSVSSLAYSTSYHYMAAINSGGVESLGAVKSFVTEEEPKTSCSTESAGNITETTATLYGFSSIPRTQIGSASVGFIYSTESEPTLGNGKSVTSKEFLTDNQFVASISGLTPNTKYYFRAFIRQNGNYLYGSTSSFTTAKINATVATNNATNIEEHSATLSGKLTLVSQSTLSTSVAFYYSDSYKTKEELLAKGTKVTVELLSDGSFSKRLTNLPHSKEYSYVAYALISGVEFTGAVVNFSTSPINASVQTKAATNISEHKATINGSYELIGSANGSPSICFYYSDKYSDASELKANGKRVSISSIPSDGSLSYSLTGLSHSTQYFYVAYAKVEDVEFFGEVISFSTPTIMGSVTTGEATSIKYHDAVLEGSMTVNTIETIPVQTGFYVSASVSSRIELKESGQKVVSEEIDGNHFVASMMGISNHRRYWYVAYLEIDDIVFLGEVRNLEMKEVPQGAIDLGLSVLWASCNVGASSPEAYGVYFQWGRTDDNGYTNRDYLKAKYSTNDILDKDDDAAYVFLGEGWRIPTKEQCEELISMTKTEATHIGDHSGIKITSLVPGFTDNSIFLPDAGVYSPYSGYREQFNYYWTSTSASDIWDYVFIPSQKKVDRFDWYFMTPIRAIYED
ncbi:MAG: fibronectin type III domain-containing protein [Bacteroidales bacterium]|nr:fibronectin type III domain-containing protein [Bacteroidales bacterium]